MKPETVDNLADDELYFNNLVNEITNPQFFNIGDLYNSMVFEKKRYFSDLSEAVLKNAEAFRGFVRSDKEIINPYYREELMGMPPDLLEMIRLHVQSELRKTYRAFSEELKP